MTSKNSFLQNLARYRQNIYGAHCHYTLNNMLNPWAKNYLKEYRNLLEKEDNNYIAIIIDDRPSDLLRNSVLNTLIMCKLKVPVILYTTYNRHKDMLNLFQDLIGYVKIKSVKRSYDEINNNIYNEIMKDKYFWKAIEIEKILLFQSDSLLIEPLEFSFFEYDYIGAPWVKTRFTTDYPIFSQELDKPPNKEEISVDINTYPNSNKSLKNQLKIGNGGLSIRNSKIMLDICDKFDSNPEEQEDVFFSRCCKEIGAKIPDLEISKSFACEGMYNKTIGMHKSYNYLSAENQAEIYERHIKNLNSLLWTLENMSRTRTKNIFK